MLHNHAAMSRSRILPLLASTSVAFACGGLLEVEANPVPAPDTASDSGARSLVTDAATIDAGPSTCEDDGGEHIFDRLDTNDASAVVMIGQCATIDVDGRSCPVDPRNAALSFGLDGHGWQISVHDACDEGALLTVAGVDDKPYPQTSVTTFLDQPSVRLVLTGGDASLDDGVYATMPSGSSTIDRGPVAGTGVSVVAGAAHVTSSDGLAHDVRYTFTF